VTDEQRGPVDAPAPVSPLIEALVAALHGIEARERAVVEERGSDAGQAWERAERRDE
jgi:hypothetical protein